MLYNLYIQANIGYFAQNIASEEGIDMREEEYKEIADKIRNYRKLRDLTQDQMAFELDIDTQYYSQLEQGRRHFTLERVVDCCKILNIKIEDIVSSPAPNEARAEEIRKDINKKLTGASCKQLMLIEKIVDSVKAFQ